MKIPWNKGKKGVQVSWNKGLKGEKSHMFGLATAKDYKWTEDQKLKLKDRIPWNKGKKGLQVAWNKGLEGYCLGQKRPKQSKSMKKVWSDPNYKEKVVKKWMSTCGIKPNKQELSLDLLLKSLFPNEWKYVGNGDTFLGGKCPDFINVNGKKQIIELYGDYWHKPEDEEIRKLHFAKYGYQTLIIWEHELTNPKQVIEKIRTFYRRCR